MAQQQTRIIHDEHLNYNDRPMLDPEVAKQRNREANKRWRENNPEKYKESAARQRVLRKEQLAEWAKNNPDKVREYARNCYHRNKTDQSMAEHAMAETEKRRAKGVPPKKVVTDEWRRLQSVYFAAKKRAADNNMVFDIAMDDLVIPDVCPLLGIAFNNTRDGAPSIDRRDSSLGYTKDNVWIISYRANRIKNDATYAEFQLMAKNWQNLSQLA